jgi:hypothetical protein
LDTPPAIAFDRIEALASETFEQVKPSTDFTPERAILRLRAVYGDYQVLVTELLSEGVRQYRYYALRGEWVEAGFDNSPDPRALRLKYGHIGADHAGESVPHLHRADKTQLFLTDEMTFEAFVDWLKVNLVSLDPSSS